MSDNNYENSDNVEEEIVVEKKVDPEETYGAPAGYGSYNPAPNTPPSNNSDTSSNGYKNSTGGYVPPQYANYNPADYNTTNNSEYNPHDYARSAYNNKTPFPYENRFSSKNKILAGILGILFGCFGVHNFYLGFYGKAIAQLLITVLSFGVLSPVSAIWGMIEGILILTARNGSGWDYDGDGLIMQ